MQEEEESVTAFAMPIVNDMRPIDVMKNTHKLALVDHRGDYPFWTPDTAVEIVPP